MMNLEYDEHEELRNAEDSLRTCINYSTCSSLYMS
jgi:hypothetical protein